MRLLGFIGPSYTLQSVNVDCQRCINLYPEVDEMGTGKAGEVASLVGTPGLKPLLTLPTAPIRGEFTDSQGQLWVAAGNTLYLISSSWTYQVVGTLNTSSGPVSMEDNGDEVVLVDGPYGYFWTINLSANNLPPSYSSVTTDGGTTNLNPSSNFQNYFIGTQTETVILPSTLNLSVGQSFNIVNLSAGAVSVEASDGTLIKAINQNTKLTVTCTNNLEDSGTTSWSWASSTILPNTFSQIVDPNFQGADQVKFMDTYFIYNKPNSKTWYIGPNNAVLPFNGLDIASKEASPDNLLGIEVTQENLYLLGTNSVEVWYDSGSESFPFQRIQGAVIEIGCTAAFSIAKLGNTVIWLGQDKDGQAGVFQAVGLQESRISTFALENVISQLGDISSSRAWSYQKAGHHFYCLNLPGATTTWCFDTLSNLWHERSYLSQGKDSRHLVDCHAFAYKVNVGGDYSNGNLYAIDPGIFTDNGNPKRWMRAAPHIVKDLNRLFYSMFQLDVETGVGVDGGTQGTNPQAILQWSDDGGHTWSNEHWTSIGPIGARKTRAIWWRLGESRDRVFRVSGTDPVKITLLGAQVNFEEAAS